MAYRDFNVQLIAFNKTPVFESGEDNKPLLDKDGKQVPLLINKLIINMLCSHDPQKEPSLTGAQQRERIRLADRIADAQDAGTPVEVNSNDITILTTVIEKYSALPLITARVLDALDKEVPAPAAAA